MKTKRLQKRKIQVRSKMHGTVSVPRLCVHKTNKALYAQLIDDDRAVTIIGISERMLGDVKGTKSEKAKTLGQLIAKKALDAKVKKVVFDRGAYRYHGRVAQFAAGAREGGLQF